MLPDTLLLVNVASTLYMFGVISLVQFVSYPLFSKVDSQHFVEYHRDHVRRIGLVVGLPMILESFSAVFLLYFPPSNVPQFLIWVGLALVFFNWMVTLTCSIPAHHQLAQEYKEKSHRFLLATNCIRTIVWSMRSVLVLVMLQF